MVGDKTIGFSEPTSQEVGNDVYDNENRLRQKYPTFDDSHKGESGETEIFGKPAKYSEKYRTANFTCYELKLL